MPLSSLMWGRSVVGLKGKGKSLSRVRLFATPWTVAYQASLSMGFFSKGTGVGCQFLLQGIFLTQGSNPGLLHCRQTLYPLSHQGCQTRVQSPLNSYLHMLYFSWLDSIHCIFLFLKSCLPLLLGYFQLYSAAVGSIHGKQLITQIIEQVNQSGTLVMKNKAPAG